MSTETKCNLWKTKNGEKINKLYQTMPQMIYIHTLNIHLLFFKYYKLTLTDSIH